MIRHFACARRHRRRARHRDRCRRPARRMRRSCWSGQPARGPGAAALRPDRAAAVPEPQARGPAPEIPGGRRVPLPGAEGLRRRGPRPARRPRRPRRQRPAALPPAPQPAPQKRSDAFDPARSPMRPARPARSAPARAILPLRRAAFRQAFRRIAGGLPAIEAARRRSLDGDGPRGPLDLSTVARSAGGLPAPGLPPQALPPPAGRAASERAAGDRHRAVAVADGRHGPRPRTTTTSPTASCCSASTIRPRWPSASSCRPSRATAWCRTPPTGWARPITGAAATPTPSSSISRSTRPSAHSRLAPDSLLKLSLSLRGMGQPEQACATLAEIDRKYPDASGRRPQARRGARAEARQLLNARESP